MFVKLMCRDSRVLNIFSGVKGLVSHGNELRNLLEVARPAIVMVSISPPEVDGLKMFLKSPFEMNLSDYEIIYGVRLAKYGEVMTPPPIYIEAVKYAVDNSREISGIDMEEEKYGETYIKHVKGSHLIRHSIRKKRILNADYHDTTPYEFAEAWNSRVNSIKGLSLVDMERAEDMAGKITDFLHGEYTPDHLIVIDHEFYRPVVTRLNAKGCMGPVTG